MDEQIQTEGPIDQPETETQPESSSETKPTEATQPSTEDKQEDAKANVPFNEDPKVQDYISRQVDSRIEKELQNRFSPKEEVAIPSWFGGDETTWKAFQADQDRLVSQAEERAVKRIKDEQAKEEELRKSANDWFEQNVRDLETSGGKVDRNKLLKTAMDYELVDTKGRWNYKAAYEILKRDDVPDNSSLEAKRQTAAATISGPEHQGEPAKYKVPRFMRKGL